MNMTRPTIRVAAFSNPRFMARHREHLPENAYIPRAGAADGARGSEDAAAGILLAAPWLRAWAAILKDGI